MQPLPWLLSETQAYKTHISHMHLYGYIRASRHSAAGFVMSCKYQQQLTWYMFLAAGTTTCLWKFGSVT